MPIKFNPFTGNFDFTRDLAVTSPITLTGDNIGFDFSTNNTWTGTNQFNNRVAVHVTDANALLIEDGSGVDRFLVDTNTPKIDLLANTNVGVAGTTGYNFDLHNTASGKGVFWRPANTGVNPQLQYVGKDGLTTHIKLSAANTVTNSSWSLLDLVPSLSGTVGKGISLPINIALTDTRTVNSAGGGFDAIRLFPMSISRSSGFSSDQSGIHQLAGLYMTFADAGTYSKSTGAVTYQAYGVSVDLSGMAPTFSATSGANTLTFSLLQTSGGSNWGGGNTLTTLAFRLIDLNDTYTQLSGVLGAGGGGIHYGIHYRPSVTVISGGALIEAALRADRSGIILASDGTLGTYSGGNLMMGASLDWDRFFESDNEAVENIPTGATYNFRINNADIVKIAAATITLADAVNIAINTSTGTKIGTATSQKLAFHNSTPVIQRAGAAQAAVATTAATNITPYGFTTAAQADAIVTLVNELRAALTEKGLIKGSA